MTSMAISLRMNSVIGWLIILCVLVDINGGACETIERRNLECSNNGALVNGICQCRPGYYGEMCKCFGEERLHEAMCSAPNSTLMCSGRGDCICGMCSCHPRRRNSGEKYTGRFCECDDYTCPFYNNALCGGPERGTCDCSTCHCYPSYSGENCACQTQNYNCIASDGSICNNHGSCECNQCHCDENYQGRTCEDTHHSLCRRYKSCVQCMALGTGPLNQHDCQQECRKQDILLAIVDQLYDGYNTCEFRDEDDCSFFFVYNSYYRNDYQVQIAVLRKKDCPVPW